MLVMACMSLAGADKAWSGCQYGHQSTSLHWDALHWDAKSNPRDHARSFRFLGQWVYERGEIKYEAWAHQQPCEGPFCRLDRSVPVSTGAIPASHRVDLPVLADFKPSHPRVFMSEWACALADIFAADVYHSVLLKPPNSL